ncbi:MAG: hypothetical protein SCH12_02565 [Nitrosomonadaceae bacterium]|nr:hypothetical protein [Nitrosospira sp.]MDW7642171.1 hypothetical protein [Nitrosomonadaceae bacterium]MDW7663744.1 hypothetical protein [Nitrosomonadaceae bacterium]MDW7664784.1 hypothetical protein [Nitrosomonadaceae bacterium]
MNIFYLSKNTKSCAKMHVDKHCVKMILEYAQLLCTAHRVIDNNQSNDLYKATHINHPSAVWARHSIANYKWLYKMMLSLLDEYSYRYGKIHATARLVPILKHVPNIINKEFTEPTPAMPEQYKISNDSITSYKNYYLGEKSHMFAWKKRRKPNWVTCIKTEASK